jgi:hypothetical protein
MSKLVINTKEVANKWEIVDIYVKHGTVISLYNHEYDHSPSLHICFDWKDVKSVKVRMDDDHVIETKI